MDRMRGLTLLSMMMVSFALLAAEPIPAKPLLEAGVIGGVFDLPDYPGANQGRTRYLGLPYFVYRGRVIEADEQEGLKGRLLDNRRNEFDLSASGAFPVSSENNRARQGMEDLDWMAQIGPRLTYHMGPKSEIVEFDLQFPLRWVFSTDLTRLDDRGFVFQPTVYFSHKALFSEKTEFITRLSWVFATKPFMSYIYGVAADEATPERPSYQAQAGLLGTALSFSVTHRFNERLLLFAGVNRSFYSIAANRQSPLLLETVNTTFVFGVIWRFYQSEARAGAWY